MFVAGMIEDEDERKDERERKRERGGRESRDIGDRMDDKVCGKMMNDDQNKI